MRKLLIVCLLVLSGCGLNRPGIDSIADGIAVSAADIETLAQVTQEMCGNTTPRGDCLPGALVSTETKNEIREQLQQALSYLNDANRALAADETARASDFLTRTETILVVVEAIVRERSQ